MTKRIQKALYYLIVLAILIGLILFFRLVKVYDVFCSIMEIVLPIGLGTRNSKKRWIDVWHS